MNYTGQLTCWGIIPQFLSPFDERPAQEQLDAGYQHSGGFRPFTGFTLITLGPDTCALTYPNDPPMLEIGRTTLRDETIILFDHSWVAIVQPDGASVVARMD